MFGELPKLFDRDFAIGFFLPGAAFLAASLAALGGFDPSHAFVARLQHDLVIGTTVLGLISWLGGVALLALNREIYMTLEGYGLVRHPRLRAMATRGQRRRFRKLHEKLAGLKGSVQNLTDDQKAEKARLLRQAAERFPDTEDLILPTGFGNILRSFEVYPRVMYGLEGVQGWTRLLAVIPKHYRALIDAAKAQTDLWVNLVVLSLLFLVEYLALAAFHGRFHLYGMPMGAVVLAAFAYARAKEAAYEWGTLVRSAFDVFLPKLREQLGFPAPTTTEEERSLWLRFSQAIDYRKPRLVPNRSGTPTSNPG